MPDTLPLPPQSLDAERAVLGACLRDNHVIAEAILILRPDDFYAAAHRLLFAVIVSMFDARQPIDLVTIFSELEKQGRIEEIGGAAYLARLWEAAPTSANLAHYAGIVRDRSLLRNLIHAGNEISHEAYHPGGPAQDVLEYAERRILGVSEMGILGQTRTLQSVLSETMARIDDRCTHKGNAGIPTGFIDLDKMTCGLQDGELILLAARPSCGKTALALSIIRHVISKALVPVLFVSLEQSRVEIGERLLSAQSGVDGQRIRSGTLSDSELDLLANASEELNRGGLLHIDDTASQGVSRIAANARRLKRLCGIRLLVIDYLQLIEPENTKVSKYEQVTTISRRLKQTARELNIPLVALAQLNREVEGRASNRPKLSDLRDTGALEQDGDVILLLHKVDSQGGSVDLVNVLVEKQRNGPTGEIPLAFCKKSVRFENYAFGDNPYAV